MDQETIVKFLEERGTLVQPEALDYLSRLSDPMDRLREGFNRGHEAPFVLTLDHARRLTEGPDGPDVEPNRLPEGEVRQARPSEDPPEREPPEPEVPDRETSEPEVPEPDPPDELAPETASEPDEDETQPGTEDLLGTADPDTEPETPDPTEDAEPPTPEDEERLAPEPDEPAEAETATRPTTEQPEPDTDEASQDEAPTPSTANVSGSPSTEPSTTSSPRTSANGNGEARQVLSQAAEHVKVELDITGESTCEGTIDDFTKLFRDRYNKMSDMLRKRRDLRGAVRIGDLDTKGGEKAVIGIVEDVKTTKNGHRILELEDDTGQLVALAQKDEQRLLDLADTLMLDEVIGITGELVRGRRGDDLFIIEELVRPDVRMDRKPRSGGPGSVIFASDVHLGADTFLADAWDEFIDWISERAREPAEEGGVRYLVIPGDLVEGVGVYPGQEEILEIEDIYDQYAKAADTLDRIPDNVHIILQPGNHDAVRPSEPQPALPESVQEVFPDTVQFVGNPCRVNITGVEMLLYHGVSLFDYFEHLPNCSIEKPVETMEEILRRRHLCPVFGGATPLAPEHEDLMTIETVPDVFVTGHVHAARTGEYRGTRLINASTWQAQTDYQRMRGFDPDPGRAFEIDLSTLDLTTWLFDYEEGTGEVAVETEDVSRKKIGAMTE